MPTYTVIGVWDHEGQDDTSLIVAGVAEGEILLVDIQDDAGALGVYTRFAATVDATGPSEAERLVRDEYETH